MHLLLQWCTVIVLFSTAQPHPRMPLAWALRLAWAESADLARPGDYVLCCNGFASLPVVHRRRFNTTTVDDFLLTVLADLHYQWLDTIIHKIPKC